MATTYQSTQDTTNFARIVRCIIGPCTEMLRDLLRREVDPNELKQLVGRALDKRKELTFHQRQNLCLGRNSLTPDYKRFDISLLYILFRTEGICQNIVPPSNGWSKPPLVPNQETVGDDIERLRLLKAEVCSHAHFPAIFTSKYCQKMRELKEICARFDQLLGKKFHDCICQIENMAMDPEIAKQYAEFAEIVHELEKKDIANDRRLADVEENLQNTDNLYERLNALFIQLRVKVLQVNGERHQDVRPAEALYPERILRREDDIRIKRNYSYLLEQINPVLILEKEHQKGIISSALKEEIIECNRKKHMTDKILKALLRSSPELYDAFHNVLQDGTINHGNVVKQLEDTDTAERITVKFEKDCCTEEMKLRLRSNERRIYDEVNTDDVVHCFLENENINQDEHSKVFYEQFRRNRIENLLNQVLIYLPWSYQIFIKSLKDHQQYQLLVKQIEKTDVKKVQKGKGTLDIRKIDVTTTSTEETSRRGTSVSFDLQTENAGQIHDEIVSKMVHLQATESTTELLHGYVENVEHGSVKITFNAASRLFWTKLKKLCDSGKIGEFIKNVIEENVNLNLLPKNFAVDFEIFIDPCVQPESGDENTGFVEIKTNLSDSYNLLVQEIDFQVITADLFEAGVIDDKNMFKTSDDPVRDLLHYLDQKERHRFDKLIEVLQKLGYSYIAHVLLEKDIEVFNNIAADDIRIIILENYTMLLDELEFELLMKASTHLSSLSNSVLQHSDGTRRNKVHWLLKSILQGKSNILIRPFLESLNYAGYQHILQVFEKTIEKIPLLRTSDGEELLSESFLFKGKMKIENKNECSRGLNVSKGIRSGTLGQGHKEKRLNFVTQGIPISKVSPSYLHSNSTSHTWPFSAIAELIDNAYDPDVNASELCIDRRVIKQTVCLMLTDNGSGMSPTNLHYMMSFGYSDKIVIGNHQPIGRYGNGFISGSMKLGKDVIVLSRQSNSMSVGMLSQTYLENINADTVLVPIVSWDLPKLKNKDRNIGKNLKAITQHSLFKSEKELLDEFAAMENRKGTGTKIIIYNLTKLQDGNFELDFVSDPADIRNPESHMRDFSTVDRPARENIPAYRGSLREYCSSLYLRPRMNIYVRGKKVNNKLVKKSLSQTKQHIYKPHWNNKHIPIIFGFTTSKNTDDYGLMFYHKNRLIKAYEKIGCQKATKQLGVGVVGIVDAYFLTPTHNKEDFDKDQKYNTFYQIVAMKLKDYLNEMNGETGADNPSSTAIGQTRAPDWTWLKCDNCQKWRRLPAGMDDISNLPDRWFCYLNPDAQFNRCDIEAESSGEEEPISYKKTLKEKGCSSGQRHQQKRLKPLTNLRVSQKRQFEEQQIVQKSGKVPSPVPVSSTPEWMTNTLPGPSISKMSRMSPGGSERETQPMTSNTHGVIPPIPILSIESPIIDLTLSDNATMRSEGNNSGHTLSSTKLKASYSIEKQTMQKPNPAVRLETQKCSDDGKTQTLNDL